MTIMSDAMKSKAIVGGVEKVFVYFGNDTQLGVFAPIAAVVAGALFTAIIQSSSASVGILQTLAAAPGSGITNSGASFETLYNEYSKKYLLPKLQ